MGFVAGVGMQNLQKGCVSEVSTGGTEILDLRCWLEKVTPGPRIVHREIAGGHSSATVGSGSPESCWSVGLGK